MTDERPDKTVDGVTTDSVAPEVEVDSAPGWRDLFKALGIIWAVEIVLSVVTAIALLAASGFRPQELTLRVEFIVPSLVLSWIVTLSVAWYFACRKFRRPVRQAFALHLISWNTALKCFSLGVATAVIAELLIQFFGNEKGYIVDLALQVDENDGTESLSLVFVAIAVLVPPIEEIYYRGFLYPTLRRLAGVPLAFVAIVLWFGLLHTPQLFGNWVAVVVVTAMGAVYTYVRQRYDSIFPSVITHFTYNGALLLFGIVASAFE